MAHLACTTHGRRVHVYSDGIVLHRDGSGPCDSTTLKIGDVELRPYSVWESGRRGVRITPETTN